MDVLQILIIIFGLLNLAFAGLIYAHSNKSVAVSFYVLIYFFASLWSLSTLATALPLSEIQFSLSIAGHYMFGYLAYLAFFWFALFFPKRTLWPLWPPVLLSVLTGIFVVFIPLAGLLYEILPGGSTLAEKITFTPTGYPFFVFMLTGVFAVGLITLLYRFRKAESQEQHSEFDSNQIYFALLTNFIAGILGIAFNLVLPLYGNFSFFYVNPILVTLALVAIGFYNLLKYNLFDKKIVLTEFFAAGIWILFFARFVLSFGEEDFLINGILFLASLFFGFFLIQSVLREVKAREEVERLAKELSQANKRLRELDQQKSEFVSIASHQLRSPLTAIRGYTSMMLEGSFGRVSQKLEKPIKKVMQSSRQLVNIVEDLLNVARIEQGRMEYDFGIIDLKKMAHNIVEELRLNIEDKQNVDLSVRSKQGEKYEVRADEDKLRQVLINLVDNAILYTPMGEIKVLLRRTEDDKILVAVEDTGIGIPKGEGDDIFDKFDRGKNATEVHANGSGIGLYIAKEIVEGHKGKIWAESEGEGKGSTFFVELPAAA